VYAASLAQIEEARARIAPHATVTPVMTCGTLDALMRPEHLLGEALETPDDESVSLFLKCETFQKGGAFKFRGAINAVLSLEAAERERGVVTHSSGNHAGALALAARTVGVPAYIVVPHGAPACKLAAIEAYGGKITRCEPTVSARERCAESLRRETGATLVPPYNHGPVICGQGTIGAEFLEQVPDLDAVIVPVSGGGMLAGIATAVKAIKPTCAVLAAEPEGLYGNGADCAWALAAGEMAPATMPPPETVCDGLRAKLGDLTWPIVRDKVDGVLVVTEREVVEAMRLVFERAKLVVEPSGAAGVAAALGPAFRAWNRAAPKWGRTLRARAVGVVLCGGNVDLQALWSTYGLE
jgi:serine racemase